MMGRRRRGSVWCLVVNKSSAISTAIAQSIEFQMSQDFDKVSKRIKKNNKDVN